MEDLGSSTIYIRLCIYNDMGFKQRIIMYKLLYHGQLMFIHKDVNQLKSYLGTTNDDWQNYMVQHFHIDGLMHYSLPLISWVKAHVLTHNIYKTL